MILYPAIDILGGNAVRLVKGDFDASKVYDQDPLAAARRWVEEGAEHLHMVDLDGARAGAPGEPRARAPRHRRAGRAGAAGRWYALRWRRSPMRWPRAWSA